jgi:hypothetical protein
MDRAMIEEHLAQAERHVAVGEHHIALQRERVARLERDGHDFTQASALLTNFEELQAIYIADRDRLEGKLANPPPR